MWLPDTGGSGGVGGGTSAGGSSNSSGTAPTPPCQGKNCPDPIITAPVLDVRQDVIAEIIEERINDNQLDDCGKDILNKLKNLTQNDISTIMSKLGETNSIYNLNIMSETPLTENALAATDWSRNLEGEIIPYNYTIKIIPHETMVSTNLAIAGTMLHEIVHAYFLSLIDDCNQTGNCTQLATFPELWNFYFSTKNHNLNTDNASQHNQLAQSYVKIIGAALQELITGYPPIGPLGSPDQVYTDIAWYGLEGTIPYSNLPETDKNRIKFRFEMVEVLNQNAINLSGQTIIPVGSRNSPCN